MADPQPSQENCLYPFPHIVNACSHTYPLALHALPWKRLIAQASACKCPKCRAVANHRLLRAVIVVALRVLAVNDRPPLAASSTYVSRHRPPHPDSKE
eukprot:9802281-Karenia_brevis.AAC.1